MKEIEIYGEIIKNAGDDLVEHSFVEHYKQLYWEDSITQMNLIEQFRDAFAGTMAKQIDEMIVNSYLNPESGERLKRILGVTE